MKRVLLIAVILGIAASVAICRNHYSQTSAQMIEEDASFHEEPILEEYTEENALYVLR